MTFKQWTMTISAIFIALVLADIGRPVAGDPVLHLKLAEADVAHAEYIVQHRTKEVGIMKQVHEAMSARQIREAEFSQRSSEFDLERARFLLELTKKTGEYYGLGPRKVP